MRAMLVGGGVIAAVLSLLLSSAIGQTPAKKPAFDIVLRGGTIADRWATVSGRARVSPPGTERPFTVIVDQADPFQPGAATLRIAVDGTLETAVSLPTHAVRITP